MRVRHVVVTGAVILIAGCAGAYVPPSADKQTATVTFKSESETDLVTPSFAEKVANAKFIDLNAYVNNKCEGRQQINVTQPGTKEHSIPVEAGKRFYFDIHAVISMRSGVKGKGSCRMNASFIPVAGSSYVVTFNEVAESCFLDVQRKSGSQLVAEESFVKEPYCKPLN